MLTTGRLAPVYSQAKRRLTLFEMRVIMRFPKTAAVSGDGVYGEKMSCGDSSHTPVSEAIAHILGHSSGKLDAPLRADDAESGSSQAKENDIGTVTVFEERPQSESFICQVSIATQLL